MLTVPHESDTVALLASLHLLWLKWRVWVMLAYTYVQVDTSAQASVAVHDQAVQASEHIVDQQIRKLEEELQGLRLEYTKRESELLSCILRVERIKGDD